MINLLRGALVGRYARIKHGVGRGLIGEVVELTDCWSYIHCKLRTGAGIRSRKYSEVEVLPQEWHNDYVIEAEQWDERVSRRPKKQQEIM